MEYGIRLREHPSELRFKVRIQEECWSKVNFRSKKYPRNNSQCFLIFLEEEAVIFDPGVYDDMGVDEGRERFFVSDHAPISDIIPSAVGKFLEREIRGDNPRSSGNGFAEELRKISSLVDEEDSVGQQSVEEGGR